MLNLFFDVCFSLRQCSRMHVPAGHTHMHMRTCTRTHERTYTRTHNTYDERTHARTRVPACAPTRPLCARKHCTHKHALARTRNAHARTLTHAPRHVRMHAYPITHKGTHAGTQARTQAHARAHACARTHARTHAHRFTPDAIMAVTLFGEAAPRSLGKFDRAVVQTHARAHTCTHTHTRAH